MGVAIVAGLAGGCSAKTLPTSWDSAGLVGQQNSETGCQRAFAGIEHAIAKAGVRDVEAHAIPGFPYLRINRFLAHVGKQFKGRFYGPAFEAWVDRLQKLGAEGLRVEVANLHDEVFAELAKATPGQVADRRTMSNLIGKCASEMRSKQLAVSTQRRLLVANAIVPDNYDDIARLLGAFPLTSIPIEIGWKTWKQENLATFRVPASRLHSTGELIEFGPASRGGALQASAVRKIVARSRSAHLQVPEPKGRDLQRLLNGFAPVWQIDVGGHYDRFGEPTWAPDGPSIGIDRKKPTVFTRVSHTVFDGQILLQLNYAIWFPARPAEGNLDLLGGHLDGLIWRVTLGADGRPLFYDSIHACGCYHLVFPLSPIDLRPLAFQTTGVREPPAIVTNAPALSPGQRIVLRVASANHYLVGMHLRSGQSGKKTRHVYRMAEDKVLRSLPLPSGERRSLYGQDGIIAGTERLEQYLLWPSGVLSPGAMRQWGHHAIALTDRRHFDDPELFARILGGGNGQR